MTEICVTKRSGNREKFNIEKIKAVIEFACEGLDVNSLALESKFDQFVYDGIATELLQENLIEHAKSLCSAEQPDWTFVAGRLKTMNRWANTRSYDIPFLDFVKEQKELGYWTHQGFDVYSESEISELGDCIVKENDLEHSFASVVTAESKYLLPNECIQHMFMGNAMIIASVEEQETRMEFCKTVYTLLSKRWVSLASPWLSNLRNNGNISSCFIIGVDDNIHSIFDNVKNAALISKAGGGLGVFLGKLRARDSSLMGTKGAATGVLGWAKIFNDTAVYVNQAGKRKGAFTVALPIWHRDIEDFLELQTEAGDQRKKAHDIKPQVTVPDLFMEIKEDSSADWLTFCPYEVEQKLGIKLYDSFSEDFVAAYEACKNAYNNNLLSVVHKVNAKELWKRLMKVQFESGMPYVTFSDRVNEHNPNKHVGNIYCGNLCMESFSVTKPDDLAHTCNLASPVVGRIPLDKLSYVSGVTAHILDNGIELTKPPIEISKKHNDTLRTIGIGIQGLHDIVARENKTYMNEQFITMLSEEIEYGAVKESIELAKKRGAYPAFKGSEWDSGWMFEKFKKYSSDKTKWEALEEECKKYGIRNSQLTSPAPNTSTSIFMDAAAGVMPVYSGFFYEDNKDGVMPVTGMFLKDNPISYSKNVTKFKPWELTKMVGWLYRYVDTGISAEYLMDKNQEGFNAKWLWDTLNDAWLNGNKTVYYVRTIKAGQSLVKAGDDCIACSG